MEPFPSVSTNVARRLLAASVAVSFLVFSSSAAFTFSGVYIMQNIMIVETGEQKWKRRYTENFLEGKIA